jgi:glucuronate isomerase
MLPTWRPDKTMAVEVSADFRAYMEKLSEVSGVTIHTYDDMIQALRKRHDFFAEQGCKLSDHGIEEFYAEDYTEGYPQTSEDSMDAQYCPYCGGRIADDFEYCPKCGKKLPF